MIPIILTLPEQEPPTRAEFVRILKQEGFDPQFADDHAAPRPRGGALFAGVLAFSQFKPEQADAALRMLREKVAQGGGSPERLITCAPELIQKDKDELRAMGSAKVVQSEPWKAGHAAERVVAALLGGFDTPAPGDEAEHEGDAKPYMLCRVPYKLTTESRRIVGATRVMRELFARIRAYSDSADPVLIRGETGTGKELVAAAIHSSNKENDVKKYIPINIAEITPDVMTSELFGHVRGAYTGASRDRQGLLAEADDGTVFIDEIGDLDAANQARLLRVFENRQIRPVGAGYKGIIPFKARLLFATHRPLEAMCAANKFRQDLYQRIREGHNLRLPSLYERKGDLELLAKEFFGKWAREQAARGRKTFILGQPDYDDIVDLCFKHNFEGNVRGMRGALRASFNDSIVGRRFRIEYLVKEVDIEQHQPARHGDGPGHGTHSVTFNPLEDNYRQFIERAEAQYFTQVYRAVGGSLSDAAEKADVSTKTFWKHLPKSEQRRKRKASKTGKHAKDGPFESGRCDGEAD